MKPVQDGTGTGMGGYYESGPEGLGDNEASSATPRHRGTAAPYKTANLERRAKTKRC